jgi:hypothetical protein
MESMLCKTSDKAAVLPKITSKTHFPDFKQISEHEDYRDS